MLDLKSRVRGYIDFAGGRTAKQIADEMGESPRDVQDAIDALLEAEKIRQDVLGYYRVPRRVL